MGCLKNALASIGCLTILIVGSIVGWQYRERLWDAYQAITANPEAIESEQGIASRDALNSAKRKQARMASADGPEVVALSPDEMAAFVEEGLDPRVTAALDSIRVSLQADRMVLEASLRTDVWGARTLGPFAGVLESREPFRISGEARIDRPGVVMWEPDEFVVRLLPFPGPAIPTLVNSLTGGTNGAIWLEVPATVGDMAIRPNGVTFYRRER